MICTQVRAALVIGLALLATRAFAINNDLGSDDRNYRVIVERNPFGLKPPPPPPTNAPAPATPKDEVLLTGITSLGGAKAYFMTKAPAGKNPEYYTLGVNDAKNGLEVLEIDTAARSVRVRNAGIESLMTFASNGVKPPATPATPPPGAPGAQPAGGAFGGVGATPPAPPGAAVGVPGLPGASTPSVSNPAATTPGSGRIRTIPSRSVRTPNAGMNPTGGAGAQPAPDRDAPVRDALMMELQKRANPNISFPPTPPIE